MIVSDGKIVALDHADKLLPTLGDIELVDYADKLICPGFIDTHVHYPQTGMIGAYGEQLLTWLETYTFPAERAFADIQHAREVAKRFLDELLRNGTTTALVFATVHPESVEAFFEQALARNLRMICGKVMMDRNAPDYLLDTAETSYQQSRELIEKWHGTGRLHYAVTPRFAPTSSDQQLAKAGQLLQEYPDLYLHTHLSENPQEIDWVSQLFPADDSYLAVYQRHGLVGPRSVFAHGIHLAEQDCQCLHQGDAAVAFCPTSNTFLGSGLFNLPLMEQHKVKVGLGTDVGAGTSFSLLQTLQDAYKVGQLGGYKIDPVKGLYLATLAGARALQLEDRVGTLATGSEADFVVLDLAPTPLIEYRMRSAHSIEDKLFTLMMLGDDRAVHASYACGVKRYDASAEHGE